MERRQGRNFTYKDNELEDTAYYLDDDSVITEKATFHKGLKNGTTYYYNTQHEQEGIYTCNNCTQVSNYRDDRLDGVSVVLSPKGDTVAYSLYKNDVEQESILRDMKGLVREHHWIIGGKSNYDSCMRWNRRGRLIEYYVNLDLMRGQPGDVFKKWDSTGVLTFLDTFYIKGTTRYNDIYSYAGGKVVLEKHFNEGLRSGRWYKKGKYELQYDSGRLVKAVSGKAPPEDEDETDVFKFNRRGMEPKYVELNYYDVGSMPAP